LSGDQLSVDTSSNAQIGAFDLLAQARSTTTTAEAFYFRVPVIVNGPTSSGVDLVVPQSVVRGIDSTVDVPSKVLSPLGVSSPADVQVINPVGLAAGLSVTSSNDGNTLTLSAVPSTDGQSKDSIFLKVSSQTQNGIIQKTVRLDCSVATFAPPSGTESFSLELNVPGTPNQENIFNIAQLLPGNIVPDPQFQYRVVDSTQLTSKGIDATLSPEGQIKLKPLTDFIPGRYQAVVEMKSGSRTVYGTLWVTQAS
jgi:hypothetical protein